MTELDDRVQASDDGLDAVFEHDLETLEEVGVRLHPKQKMLARMARENPWTKFDVIVPRVVTSPSGYRFRQEPILFENDEFAWYPAIGQVCWAEAFNDKEPFDLYEKGWKRFPSLPTRYAEASPWLMEAEYGGWEGMRIWDLWPSPHPEFGQVLHEGVCEWLEDEYMLYLEWMEVDRGEVDPCEYAEAHGGGSPDEHEHVTRDGEPCEPDMKEYDMATCQTGERIFFEVLESMSVPDPSGEGRVLKPWKPLELPQPFVDEDWRPLLASSRRNSQAALTAFPPWDRDEILRYEREYSPWLWLSS